MSSYSPVPELNELHALQQRLGFESYADGFGLTAFGDLSGLEAGWSKDPAFLQRLIPFAQANGSGSFYAFWRVDERADLGTLPVAVFGDEGGQHIVARDIRELFQLLGFDTEITVDFDQAYFYRGDDQEHTAGHDEYVAWLHDRFSLAAASDPDSVVAAAQEAFGEQFTSWAEPFLD